MALHRQGGDAIATRQTHSLQPCRFLVRVRRTSPRTLSFPAHVLDKDKPKIVVRETQKRRLDEYSLLCDRRVRRSLVVGGWTIRYGSCSGESRLLRRDQPRVESGVRV